MKTVSIANSQSMIPGWLERKAFVWGLKNPFFFRFVVRREAYRRAGGDPELVHEHALKILYEYEEILEEFGAGYQTADLKINLKGIECFPFGSAAGLDKNAEALRPLSHIFGFMEPGTVVVEPREGNPRPRVFADAAHNDIFNAQGFPSQGLDVFERNIRDYRESGGKAPIFTSICGIPETSSDMANEHDQMKSLLTRLTQYADGFVWNPFSPNTDALNALRTPEQFRWHVEIMSSILESKQLKLVKMGPYEQYKKDPWIELVGTWMENGGDGVVLVNSVQVPRERLPMREWGYDSAGRSGRALQHYRQRAIEDVRVNFPKALIIATGGIESAEQAWNCFEAGAHALEGYTPYTFYGFGLLKRIAEGIKEGLKERGFESLQDYLDRRTFEPTERS